jgi:ABC-type antimicrobial peptide transport system permease subunit
MANMKATFKLAWVRAFRSKKGLPNSERSSRIIIGGVTLVAALIMMFWATNVESTVGTARYFKTNTYDYIAMQGEARSAVESSTISPELMKDLRSSDGVEAVGVTWYFGKLNGRDVLYGMYREGGSTAPLLSSGRHLRSDNETVIDVDLANSLGIKLGDEVKLVDKPYYVVGLSRETGSFGKEMVFISEQAMFDLYVGMELYNSIAISTHGKPAPTWIGEKWGKEVTFLTRQEYIDGNIDYWSRNVSSLILTIIVVVAALGGIGLTTVVSKLLQIRMAGLGRLRAIGASKTQVAGAEAMALSWLFVIGMVVALPFGWAFIQITNLTTPGFHASLTLEAFLVASIAMLPIWLFAVVRLVKKARKASVMALIGG